MIEREEMLDVADVVDDMRNQLRIIADDLDELWGTAGMLIGDRNDLQAGALDGDAGNRIMALQREIDDVMGKIDKYELAQDEIRRQIDIVLGQIGAWKS